MRPQKSNRKVARPCSERLFQNTNETDWLTGDELMGNEGSYVALGLKTWNAQIERADKLFAGFSSEEILREIAPGRNRLLYLWGHLTAVHDAMLPLLSLGERLHPEFDAPFVSNPDKSLPQFSLDDVPCPANLFVRRNVGSRFVGIRDEGGIKLGMKSFSQRQQREHRVVYGCEMSPQVKKPVPARRYFPENLLGREACKKLVRALNLSVPCFQPESYVRAFVSHQFVSCQPVRFICILEKSFRTWARHFSIALLWPHPESHPNVRRVIRPRCVRCRQRSNLQGRRMPKTVRAQ